MDACIGRKTVCHEKFPCQELAGGRLAASFFFFPPFPLVRNDAIAADLR